MFTVFFSVHLLVHDLSVVFLVIVIILNNLRKRSFVQHRRQLIFVALILYLLPLVVVAGNTGLSPLVVFVSALVFLKIS
jgi:hypothetical protein